MTVYTLVPITLVSYPAADGQQDVVFRVGWNYNGVDAGYVASFYGQTELTYKEGSPYTPYDKLTEEQVVGWVLDAWGPEQTAANQARIDEAIALQKNPPTQVLPLPWVQPEPPAD